MTEIISNDVLFRAILHGANCTREQRDALNRINVFPVVDNDTGTNLAHTMHYILRNAAPAESVRSTLRTVARSALIGARGNSGAIFSQYFNGLYQGSLDKDHVTLGELAVNFQEAFNRAFRALETPVEGTVITLMRAWAVTFREQLEERKSMRELFESSLERLRHSLEETSETLEALKKLHIVDAGALGFYYFMEGFVQVILGKASYVHTDYAAVLTTPIEEDIHRYSEHADIEFRYCTEVLLETDSLDADGFREALKPLGDCLLLSAGENLARVHLHTNQPWEVVRLAAARGRILENKADDMVQQNELGLDKHKGIALVTDSIADLPREYVNQHGIFQFPINIMIDGVSYLDKLTVSSEFLNANLNKASTAQPNAQQILGLLRPILHQYDKVLIMTVSAHMSGTHSRFAEALAELGPDAARVALVDTRVNSGAQGLLVREAARLIQSGLPFPDIVASIEAMRSRAKIVVSVLDIEPMARSGRVSEKIGNLLIKLRFKPLVSIDREGKGTIKGVAFSEAKNWKILIRSLRGKPVDHYAIVYAGDPMRAEKLRTEMIRLFGREPVYMTEISSAVTLFAGKGSVAVAYLEK